MKVPLRHRQAFQYDALFELVVGCILLGNPLLGPRLPWIGPGPAVALGVALLLAAIFLGGAGLGKGPLARRLPVVSMVNAASGIVLIVGGVAGGPSRSGGRIFAAIVGIVLLVLAGFQRWALHNPDPAPTTRRRATPSELRAAIGAPDSPPSP